MSPRVRLVSALFFFSGATGLLYQVAFSKVLATIFGATAYAVSTVLAAFMAGLALGAHFGGRIAHRLKSPLVGYGIAELGVAALCAGTPLVFASLADAYVGLARAGLGLSGLTALRGTLTFVVILLPTTCMGATLPMLSRMFAGTSLGERTLPLLYAINTFGGALGALLSAYAILPALGVRGTMMSAAVVNAIIGVAAILIGRRDGSLGKTGAEQTNAERAPSSEAPKGLAGKTPLDLLGFALASGFLVFAVEVVQTHLLTLLIGNSAYAFGLMLTAFLVCLSIGAALAPRLSARLGRAALVWGFAFSALTLALMTPLWDQLPRLFAAAGKLVHSWAGREFVRGAAAFVMLALPTLAMGTTFPLLLSRIGSEADAPRHTARLTIASTIGTILGSISTGYWVLPWLGSQRSLVLISTAFALLSAAAVMSAVGAERRRIARGALLGGLGAVLALLAPSWNLARLTNGANVYFTYGPAPDDIPFVREDIHGGVTTVARRNGVTTMYTNGKFQGDDGPEMAAQRRFAHFPGLFLPAERRALVIGLGTGTTLGAVLAYPFEQVDAAEISPAIIDAADAFFSGPNRGALHDPRVNMIHNDGRNVLLVSHEKYDLIAIELTSVWFAGASNLYSKEFYELTKTRLSEGGVLQQWVQLHHIRPRELGAILRTMHQVYPHMALFEGGSQGILVASEKPLVASSARLDRLASQGPIRETLDGRSLETLLDELVLSDSELTRLADDIAAQGDGPILSSDDNLLLEYATPKGNVLDYNVSLQDTLELLGHYRTPDVRARHLGP